MISKDDLYIILEIDREASLNDIKRAFRKLARRYHPDINPGDRHAEERFKRITEAYDVLSDPLKREFYDINGFYTEGVLEQHSDGASSQWGFSFQGFRFSRSGDTDFREIFGHITHRHKVRGPERGQDLEYPISISFDESIKGVKANISLTRACPCPTCDATGQARGTRENVCPVCGGSGKSTRVK